MNILIRTATGWEVHKRYPDGATYFQNYAPPIQGYGDYYEQNISPLAALIVINPALFHALYHILTDGQLSRKRMQDYYKLPDIAYGATLVATGHVLPPYHRDNRKIIKAYIQDEYYSTRYLIREHHKHLVCSCQRFYSSPTTAWNNWHYTCAHVYAYILHQKSRHEWIPRDLPTNYTAEQWENMQADLDYFTTYGIPPELITEYGWKPPHKDLE